MKRQLKRRLHIELLSAALLSAAVLTACSGKTVTEAPAADGISTEESQTEASQTEAPLTIAHEESSDAAGAPEDSNADNTLEKDRIIEDQSFDITLNRWGSIRFVSYAPAADQTHDDVAFYLMENGGILYEFPQIWEEGAAPWTFESVDMVSFQDIDSDGNEDVIALISYITGAGPEAAVPFPVTRIYMGDGTEFTADTELAEAVDENHANGNIGAIMDFIHNRPGMETGNPAAEAGNPVTEEAAPGEDPMYDGTGIKETEAREFLETLTERVKNGDKEEVSRMISYPKKVVLPEKEVIVQSAEEFTAYYDEIFTEDYKERLYEFMEKDDIWSNYMGVALGNGEMWLNKRDGVLAIDVINNADDRRVGYTEDTGIQAG